MCRLQGVGESDGRMGRRIELVHQRAGQRLQQFGRDLDLLGVVLTTSADGNEEPAALLVDRDVAGQRAAGLGVGEEVGALVHLRAPLTWSRMDKPLRFAKRSTYSRRCRSFRISSSSRYWAGVSGSSWMTTSGRYGV